MPRVLTLNVTDSGRRPHPPSIARLPDLDPDLFSPQYVRSDTATARSAISSAPVSTSSTPSPPPAAAASPTPAHSLETSC